MQFWKRDEGMWFLSQSIYEAERVSLDRGSDGNGAREETYFRYLHFERNGLSDVVQPFPIQAISHLVPPVRKTKQYQRTYDLVELIFFASALAR